MAQKKLKNNGAVEKKLVGVADVVITAAQRSKDPALSIPVRSLANVNFNEKRGIIEMGRRKQARTFFNVGMAKKFVTALSMASVMPTTRPQVRPLRTAAPAKATTRPTMRWIQPQLVASNWNR